MLAFEINFDSNNHFLLNNDKILFYFSIFVVGLI